MKTFRRSVALPFNIVCGLALSSLCLPAYSNIAHEQLSIEKVVSTFEQNSQATLTPEMFSLPELSIVADYLLSLDRSTISAAEQQAQLLSSLHFLERYSFYGKKPEEAQLAHVDNALSQVIKLLVISHSATENANLLSSEIHRLVSRNLQRWLLLGSTSQWFESFKWLTSELNRQLSNTIKTSTAKEQKEQWETLLSHMTYLRWLRSKGSDEQKAEFVQYWPTYFTSLKNALSKQALAQPWLLEHILWLTAKSSLLLEDEKQLDEVETWVVDAIHARFGQSSTRSKQLITDFYMVPNFKTQESCEEERWKNSCHSAELTSVLPIKHECSSSLFILAEQLTETQLNNSCAKLTSQETHFHQLFKTEHKPVANDDNTSLRVVVFNDWSQYHRYAPMLFDINTDNGGMYIEGTPSKPDNQATFFAFEAFWLRPEFKVWNLNHEYVHYLTGRYTTYGPFGHFPSHLVWWSEGVAEYIAKNQENERAEKLLLESTPEEFKTLKEIFNTTYNDGSKMVYHWSYWGVRFLAEKSPELLVSLKNDIYKDYFEGYEAQLTAITKQHNAAFQLWLTSMKSELSQKSSNLDAAKEKLPRKTNRYLYPEFLKPKFMRNEWLK